MGSEPVVSMRHPCFRLSATLLVSVLLPAGMAQSQGKGQPGWVDPPAKSAAPAPTSAAEAPPAASAAEAPKTESSKTEGSKTGSSKTEPSETLPARRTAERSSRRAVHRPLRAAARGTPPAAVAPDGRLVEWAGAAQDLARDYLDSVSAPGSAMLAATPRFYAGQVRFYGRTLTLAALTAEKRRFVQRWPERRYEPRSGTMRTACSAALALCRVETVIDFRAENPARGLRSQGISTVGFEVSFAGGRPAIVSETSRVLRRDGPVSALSALRRPV